MQPLTIVTSDTSEEVRAQWIPRRTELFRHIRPPEADIWLGANDAAPSAGTWTLETLAGPAPTLHIESKSEAIAAAIAAVPADLLGEYIPLANAHAVTCTELARLELTGDNSVVRIRRRASTRRDAPFLVVAVAAGAKAVLIEDTTGAGDEIASALTRNALTAIHLGEGARLRHIRIRREPPGEAVASRTTASVAAQARYEQLTIASGAGYHLERSEIDLCGEDAAADSAVILLASADRLEQQVEMRHASGSTTSRFEALVLAAGGARVVVNARTIMPRKVPGASADQHLHGIPTAGNPRIVLRPHLEILHDEVEARHGATWGSLSEDAIFYATQRGLDPATARALIVEGLAIALADSCIDDSTLLEQSGFTAALAEAVAAQVRPDPEQA